MPTGDSEITDKKMLFPALVIVMLIAISILSFGLQGKNQSGSVGILSTSDTTVTLQYGRSIPELNISSYTGTKDAGINAEVPNAGYYQQGAASQIIYRWQRIGLYWFDLSAIPRAAVISDARLILYSIPGTYNFNEAGAVPIYLVQTLSPNNNIVWSEGNGTNYYAQDKGTSWLAKDNFDGARPRYPWSSLSGRTGTGDLSSAYESSPIGKMNFVKSYGAQQSDNLAAAISRIIGNNYQYEGFAVDRSLLAGDIGRQDGVATKEYADMTKRPALQITYSVPNSSPTVSPILTSSPSPSVSAPAPTPTPITTPTATASPTPSSPPVGSYIILPSLPPLGIANVPTPVSVTLPTPNRILRVGDNTGFAAAVTASQPGDWIVLAPGTYSQILLQKKNLGSPSSYLVIAGEPGAVVNGASVYAPFNDVYVTLYAMNFINTVNIDYAKRVNVIGSKIYIPNIVSKGIKINHQSSLSSFKILNNHIFTDLAYTGVWGEGDYGIYFGFYEGKGDNTRIAGNQIHGWWDGMSLGQSGGASAPFNNPTYNWSVDHNVIYDINDDAIEADGWHSNLTISDNIIGGTNKSVRMGISLAPGGPGPIYVKNNFVSGFSESPFKFNTEVNQAYTKNVLIQNNTVIQVSGNPAMWLQYPPTGLTENISIINNVFLGTGTLFWLDHATIKNLIFDYNKWYSTKVLGDYNKTGDNVDLFIIYNGSTGNIYYKTFSDFRAAQNQEAHGQYMYFSAQPIPVGNLPLTKIATWETSLPTPTPSSDLTPPILHINTPIFSQLNSFFSSITSYLANVFFAVQSLISH